MNRLKPSKYNFFFDAGNGKMLAFNAFSGALAEIEKEKYAIVQQILNAPNRYSYDTSEKLNLKEALVKSKFLVDEDLNELDVLKIRNRKGRFSTDQLSLTIAPTLDCNLRCTYCYETNQKIHITYEVVKQIQEFVKRMIRPSGGLSVTWYGGEPLLCLNQIVELTGEFRKICADNHANYGASMITNGYLLSRKVAQQLAELQIDSIQITLDGPQPIHDSRRITHNGQGTFNTILRNIEDANGIINRLTIRINVDRENIEHVIELAELLKQRGLIDPPNTIYLERTMPATVACADVNEKCLNNPRDRLMIFDAERKFVELGITPRRGVFYPKLNMCIADRYYGFLIGPSGELYKCFNTMGTPEHVVGTIFDKELSFTNPRLLKWLAWDIFEYTECRNCTVLPICMGGCPYYGMQMSPVPIDRCLHRKELIECAKSYYLWSLREK